MFIKKISIFLLSVLFIFLPFAVGCGERLNEYSVSVQNYMSYGIVTGNGNYLEGNEATISAKPIQSTSNQFKCWIHNYEIASFDSEYTFVVNKESAGTYIAIFDMSEPALITLDSLQYSPISNDNIELKKLQIYYSTNELSYTLVYDFNENFNLYNSISEFEKPFALLNTNDLYVKVIEQYTTTSIETGEESTITTTTMQKISKDTLIDSISNNTIVTLNINEPVINSGNPTLTFKFNYIDNYDIDGLFKNTEQ